MTIIDTVLKWLGLRAREPEPEGPLRVTLVGTYYEVHPCQYCGWMGYVQKGGYSGMHLVPRNGMCGICQKCGRNGCTMSNKASVRPVQFSNRRFGYQLSQHEAVQGSEAYIDPARTAPRLQLSAPRQS